MNLTQLADEIVEDFLQSEKLGELCDKPLDWSVAEKLLEYQSEFLADAVDVGESFSAHEELFTLVYAQLIRRLFLLDKEAKKITEFFKGMKIENSV